MSSYPRELIFKERKDIDDFLSEPGLNSALYEVLLAVREPNDVRYALKVTPLKILNEAYGQALRVVIDNHPEEDYYNNYFLNAKKYFERSYEVELVFCIVYVLLKFSHIESQNVKRFMNVIERRMEDKPAYFPAFKDFIEATVTDPFYDYDSDRFYLRTDEITPKELRDVNWYAATIGYNETQIRSYLGYAIDTDYQIAILDSIYSEYDFEQILGDFTLIDIKPMIDGMKSACQKYPKQPRPLPVVKADYNSKQLVYNNNLDLLQAEVERLREENEELKKKREEEESNERTAKIKDIVAIGKTFPESERKAIFNMLRLLISDQDDNWIERINAEEKILDEGSANSAKYRIANRRGTDFIKIISAMYDLRMFMTPEGLIASNKQDVMNAFGKVLQMDMSSYSTLLSTAKGNANFLEIFDNLKNAAEKYQNE